MVFQKNAQVVFEFQPITMTIVTEQKQTALTLELFRVTIPQYYTIVTDTYKHNVEEPPKTSVSHLFGADGSLHMCQYFNGRKHAICDNVGSSPTWHFLPYSE